MGIDSPSPTQGTDLQQSSVDDLQQRYLNNLQRLERIDVSALYPPEMKRRKWQPAAEGSELDEFLSHIRPLDLSPTGGVNNGVTAAFSSEDGYIFAAPELSNNPNLRNLLLDMLATMKELSPWSKVVGMKRAEKIELFDTSKVAMYTFAINWIVYYPAVIRNIVNGLGGDEYSTKKKEGFIIEDVASLIHESVHIENAQDLDMGGPHRVLVELAPITCEYLAFSGRNPKMSALAENALRLLTDESIGGDSYSEGLLLGLVILAQQDGALGENDNRSDLVQNLEMWKLGLEKLDREELDYKRRQYEQVLLSENDVVVRDKILELGEKYPVSLGLLSLVDWLKKTTIT